MTEPSCEVVCDSISPDDHRITTVVVRHHRFILAETNTHRMISKSSASSRAIPVAKQLEKVQEDLAFPVRWPAEKAGMQGGSDLAENGPERAQEMWESARSVAVAHAKVMSERINVHKSVTNRLLEPFMWHTAIWTFDHTWLWNFLAQRDHPDAQPEFGVLARKVREALEASEPEPVMNGHFHMPFIRPEDYNDALRVGRDTEQMILQIYRKISVARCARVSYLNHDGVRSIEDDLRLYERLRTQSPPHAGPFEHVATPWAENRQTIEVPALDGFGHSSRTEVSHTYTSAKVGNLTGWLQLRHGLGM